jgi:hypothetical protein
MMKLLDFIVCDDIRQEMGNKPSLMGVYDNIILPPSPEGDLKWPVALRLGFFIKFLMEPDDVHPEAFRVEFIRDGSVFSKVEGIIKAVSANGFSIALVNSAFQLIGVGPISFKIVFLKEGETIGQFEPDYCLQVEVAKESQKTVSKRM